MTSDRYLELYVLSFYIFKCVIMEIYSCSKVHYMLLYYEDQSIGLLELGLAVIDKTAEITVA